MKKLLTLLSLLTLISGLMICLIGCGENETEVTENKNLVLNVYNWGEYISDGAFDSLDSNKAFEEYYYDKYGVHITVNYSTYATNEDMYSKLKNSAVSYDIVIPSDYMIQKMIEEDMLLSFDVDELSNFENIDDYFKNPYYDPEGKYSVPYTYGMLGVIYNTNLVDEEDIGSWDLLWNPKYKGKILQFNNPRDAFASAMYYKGIDVNSTDPESWNYALEILKEQKPLVQGYVNDEIFNKMTTASAAIAPYFVGDYITMAEQEEALAFYYPEEGVNYFVDAMCIPKNSKNPELAKEYINFMLSEEPAVANAEYIGYASPNNLVKNNPDYIDYMGEDIIELLYEVTPAQVNAKYEKNFETACYKSFSPEIQNHVNTLWESLKTENSTELWVHITSIFIVVLVLGYAFYSTYIKKKRSRHYRLRDRENKLKALQQKSEK